MGQDKMEKTSYYLCPKCYNNNPINDIEIALNEKGLLCDECPNKECQLFLFFAIIKKI